MEQPSARVSRPLRRAKTKPAEEVRARWAWTEPTVWTERMLTALENGVRGGKWFSLIDKVARPANLRAALARVVRNRGAAGVDHVTVRWFDARRAEELRRLEARLGDDSYRPQAIRRTWIPKPGSRQKRPLGIPTVGDRVVQTALRNVLEPIFERDFAPHSYGFRPGRSAHDALDRVETLLEAGYRYVVDADLKSYFDTIPHERLMALVEGKVSDRRVLALIRAFLRQDVLEEMRRWSPTAGSPQGAVISPLLSNIYLDLLDHRMAEQGFEMVRYADDFVVLCRTRTEAEAALEWIRQWTAEAGLSLHPEKTHTADAVEEGFEFLGYRFVNRTRIVRPNRLQKLKETVRAKTRRTDGRSLAVIVADLNRTLRGWLAYFHRSNRVPFAKVDAWLRMRLRSILRKRRKRKGRGRGLDQVRWPNAYFAEHGLVCLDTAHVSYRQSSRR